MFGWILIAFVIALIFGVIKIEQLKTLWNKIEPTILEIFAKAKNSSNNIVDFKNNSSQTEEKASENTQKSE